MYGVASRNFGVENISNRWNILFVAAKLNVLMNGETEELRKCIEKLHALEEQLLTVSDD